ncbi:hypothetical protein G6F42_025954 [Rhizopus arrhizus]|nr:hypothetical protein G6F42_025954 [Rhizopus arrhizus]
MLKKLLTTAPILSRPDFNEPFMLVTDASKLGLGAILTQLDKNGHEHPIIYASRGLKSTESNYAPTKLECLAVIWAIKMFRPYLLGKKFTVITDHSALNGLLKTPNPTGIIARWITILSEYEFEIKYRPGRINENNWGMIDKLEDELSAREGICNYDYEDMNSETSFKL